MVQRKLSAKKKNEKSLAALIKSIQMNEGKVPEEGSQPKTP